MAGGWLSGALRASALVAGTCLLANATLWAQAGNAGCSAAAHQTAACAAQAFAEADETIAVLYADLQRALSAQERPQLRKEHIAWLRGRNSRCPTPPETSAAADALAQHHACMTLQTQARRQGLMRWLTMDSPATLP